MTSYKKSRHSVNRCTFTYRTILSAFIPIRFETTEPYVGFFEEGRSPQREEQQEEQDELRYEISS